ncbi:MAG: DUF5668 domain-containing protein [Desulfitobacteriaceae bacterium]|nr:DUF5668 domain-containing protein [Desulfitobacteriaceae bacterium]MDI6878835.1 DUF5668 domain-containing protein [Desulfitobacteriaceae bacterium]MDI6914612.1 DUF5668 domain-containing protein [Desulfitobacteriaceae bacterium]
MRNLFDSLSRGFLLIAVGLIFLLINFGLLPWSFWLSVVDLWPLLLILIGISFLFKKKVPFSAVLLVFLLVLAGYSLVFGPQTIPHGYFPMHRTPFGEAQESGVLTTEVQLPAGVTKASLDLNLGGAKVNLQTLTAQKEGAYLMAGTYRWDSAFASDQPSLASCQTGDRMDVTLSSQNKGGSRDTLDLGLNRTVHYDVKLNAGAINGDLDFSEIPLDSLRVNTGASKFRLAFGDTGIPLQVKLNTGASDLTLAVPDPVGLHVHVSGVASNTDFMGSGLFLDKKDWHSPGYDQAKTKIDLEISMAAGSLHLDRSVANTGSL